MKKVFLFCFILLFCTKCQNVKDSGTYYIKNINIVDVQNGGVLANQNVLIEGNKIKAIYLEEVDVPDSTQIIDGEAKYLMPGLWDMHGHFLGNYQEYAPLLIANGVTGIREMSGEYSTLDSVKKEIAIGNKFFPDIYSAGNIIEGRPKWWNWSVLVQNKIEAVKEVENQLEQGIDFIKIYTGLNRESYFAIAEKCRQVGKPFAGHIPSSVSMWEAIDAGQQSSEHLYGLLEACIPDIGQLKNKPVFGTEHYQCLLDNFQREKFDSLTRKLANSNTWLCPTLTMVKNYSMLDNPELKNDPRMKYMPKEDLRWWNRGNAYEKSHYDVCRSHFKLEQGLLGDLEKAGVKIIAGTDFKNPYCYPGFSLHDELELMVDGGMSVLSVLQSATSNAAKFINRENEFGSIEMGKTASLLLLDANPLANISNTKKISGVFQRGKYYNKKDLEEILLLK